MGLIVNPIAGMGGRVGLKGTDGQDVLERALELGAVPVAEERAARALGRLAWSGGDVQVVAAAGELGADVAHAHGLATEALLRAERGGPSSAEDTRAAAAELARRDVDLILFAGGDGTARDIHAAVGDRVPVLGIPTGVKMHSSVFATTPENAGEVAASFLGAERPALREAEIVDFDDAAGDGDLTTRLYGAVRVPDDRLRMQGTKSGTVPSDEDALEALCARIADAMDPRRVYVLGPGTTTRRVLRRLGLPKTLLGVDAVRGGQLVGSDLGERELLDLVDREAVTLLVGVVGGQGALFGRGNQQLSPAVLRRIGPENVEVLAGLHKLLALDPPWLRVDTGEPELDAALGGYRRVHVAPNRTLVYKVAA